jgi:hypothetical protein
MHLRPRQVRIPISFMLRQVVIRQRRRRVRILDEWSTSLMSPTSKASCDIGEWEAMGLSDLMHRRMDIGSRLSEIVSANETAINAAQS